MLQTRLPLIQKIILLTLIVNIQTAEIKKYPFSFKYFSKDPAFAQEGKDILQEEHLQNSIGVTHDKCSSPSATCEILYVLNFKSEIIGKYRLPIGLPRVRKLIFKLLEIKNVKIQSKTVGNKDIQVLKENMASKVLDLSLNKIKNLKSHFYEDDWHRAKILTQNKIITSKRQEESKKQKENKEKKETPSRQTIEKPKQNLKEEKLSTKVEDYYGWYVVYFFLIAGLIGGMCYVNSIEKESAQPQKKPIQSEETDKLASTE